MEVSALTTAKLVTQLASKDSISDLSPLKLQKLLYFIEGQLLADDDIVTFFPETPEAWKYGPVYVDIYEKFKTKQNREPIIEKDFEDDISANFEEAIRSSIESTWNKHKTQSASELVTLTHRTAPWIIAKDFGYGSRISKEDMREYFTQLTHGSAI